MKRSLLLLAALPLTVAGITLPSHAAAQARYPMLYQAIMSKGLRHLILADSSESATNAEDRREAGFLQTENLPLFDTPEFRELMQSFVGRPITQELVNEIAKQIGDYIKTKDRVSVHLEIPKQDAGTGTLRLVVKPGRYNSVSFRGNRWFKTEQLAPMLRVTPGNEVLLSELDEAVAAINANPFRRVQVMLTPNASDKSKTDLIVGVKDRLPLRALFSYENGGSDLLGVHQFGAGVAYGNLFSRDQVLSYDFRTSDKPSVYQSHSASYQIPLPWKRDNLSFQVAFANIKDLSIEGGYLKQNATNYAVVAAYSTRYKTSWGEINGNAGFSFKRADSDLLYRVSNDGDYENVNPTSYTVAQFNLGASTILRDKLGAWLFGASLNLSPGRLGHRNGLGVYEANRPYASPCYAYASFNLQRQFLLPRSMDFVTQVSAQLSNKNLMGSEQLSIGGSDTVRGYDERIRSGDEGIVVQNELHGPIWRKALIESKSKTLLMQVQPVLFMDYAKVRYHRPIASDIRLEALASAGLGVRCNLANTCNVVADYGWQLKSVAKTANGGRASIRVSMVF